MEILGIKDSTIREAPRLPEQKPTEKAETPRKEKAPAPKDFPKTDLANNEQAVKALTEHINSFMKDMRYSLQFVPDLENGRVLIKVLDSEGKVVRRIPPELLEGLDANAGAMTGLVVNETLE